MIFNIYTKPDCVFCTRAKNLMTRAGIQYIETVIGKDISRDDFIAKFPDQKTVPLIFGRYNEYIGGYEQLKEKLNVRE